MRPILILALLLGSGFSIQAYDDATETQGVPNGRAWNGYSETAKVYYLVGFRAGVIVAEQSSAWAEHFTVGDYKKELNKLYSSTENVNIPIVLLIKYITRKLNGDIASKDLDRELERMRAFIRVLLQQQQPQP